MIVQADQLKPTPLSRWKITLSPWKAFLGVLCVALVMVASTLSVAHSHAHAVDEHGTCGLCVSAHMAAALTAPAPQIVLTQVFIELEPAAPVARPQSVPHFALFSRPPPVATHLS
jgi:hypothetical protein